MHTPRKLVLFLASLLLGDIAAAQAPDGEWISYRDAYRVMAVFEKYDQEKNLLQNRLQIRVGDKDAAARCTRLTISTAASQQVLPLDMTGSAAFPMMKSAYDENTRLVMDCNAPRFAYHAWVSIAPRPDGVYSRDNLSAACEQALRYHRYNSPSTRSRRCAGVRFVFAPQAGTAQETESLRKDKPDSLVISLRDSNLAMPLITTNAPLSIVALFE